MYNGSSVKTGIFKEPVSGPVALRTLNLDGDRQADLRCTVGHTRLSMGILSEHYEFWRQELPGTRLPWGMFGENFTSEGLFEDGLHIGDRLQIGQCPDRGPPAANPVLQAAPLKFRRNDILARFLRSGRSGFIFPWSRKGRVEAGDSFEFCWQGAARDQPSRR